MIAIDLLLGLLLSLGLWFISFCIGHFVISIPGKKDEREIGDPQLTILISSATGLAIIIFGLFCLASVHLFTEIGIISTLALTLGSLAAAMVARHGITRTIRGLASEISEIRNPAWLLAFTVCVVLSAPSLMPPAEFDATMYHLAYAVDWSNAGYLRFDPFLRFPLAQFNVELLFAAFYALHIGMFVNYVTWLFFVISSTGIAVFVGSLLLSQGMRNTLATTVGAITSLGFIASPLVLHYADVAYVDVPAGGMLLALGAALTKSRKDFTRYSTAVAIIGGSFVGMKLSLAPMVVAIALSMIVIGGATSANPKRIYSMIAVLVLFASPWFLRSLMIAGDPIDPVLNLALHHSDPLWTQADLDGQKADLRKGLPVLLLPIYLFFNPSIGGDALSLAFCFLYTPLILVAVAAFNRNIRGQIPDLLLVSVVLCVAITDELIVTDRVARYSLHFYALALVAITASIWLLFSWLNRRFQLASVIYSEIATALVISLLAIPGPGASTTYYVFDSKYTRLDLGIRRPAAYLAELPGYDAANDLADIIADSGRRANVLTINFEYLAYFFRIKKVTSLGDFFGPGRVSDLRTAIDDRKFDDYIKKFDVGAIMYLKENTSLSKSQENALSESAVALGFKDLTKPESDVVEFVRGDILADARAHGYKKISEMSGTLDLIDHFNDSEIGKSSQTHFAQGARSADIYRVLHDDDFVKSITIDSGYHISFKGVHVERGSTLSFDVAKVTSVGPPAVAWVDVRDGSRTKRIFSRQVPSINGVEPHFSVIHRSLGTESRTVDITFGASSIPGGGSGDWVAFVAPTISKGTMKSSDRERPKYDFNHFDPLASVEK